MEQNLHNVRIAAAQFNVLEGDKDTNLNRALQFIRTAAAQAAKLVLLPEMFLTGYPLHIPMSELAEPMEGDTLRCIQSMAQEHKIAVVGSYPEWDLHDACSYNTAFFIGEDGRVIGKYRKIHLFDQEKSFVEPGRDICVIDYNGLRYGLIICFDLEFPEPSRALALAGTQILLVVSANMDPYCLLHRVFVRARAIENHMYVAYCNRTGDNKVYSFCGESCLVNPVGELICELGQEE
ncbi:MAG: nitrilase-related carbon-nitrogen hydrolase, partial [Bacillota bacterium]